MLAVVGGASLAAAGFATLFLFDPSTSAFYPPCPFHALTGLYCPGCGTTRAAHELLHGDLAAAFGLNPLMVLALPYLGYSAATYAIPGLGGRPLKGFLASPRFAWLVLRFVLLFWLLRNIPLYPFSLLAP
jgi:hypothetical protein